MPKKTEIPDFRKIAEEALRGMPEQVGEQARAHFLMSFIKQGFTDVSYIPWPRRKDLESHKMLSQSLALRSSIRVAEATMQIVRVVAGEGLPYAAIHNNGGIITVPVTRKMKKYFWAMFKKTGVERYKWMALTKKKEFTIRIPKRQYIGDSHQLLQDIDKKMMQRIITAQKNMKFN